MVHKRIKHKHRTYKNRQREETNSYEILGLRIHRSNRQNDSNTLHTIVPTNTLATFESDCIIKRNTTKTLQTRIQ